MRFIAILAFVASTSAFACPNISGNYLSCTASDGQVAAGMEVTQRIENGVTIYQSISVNEETGEIEKDDMIADGKKRTVAESEGYESSNTVSCADGQLIIESSIMDPSTGLSGLITIKVKKEGTKLISEASGVMLGQEFRDTSVCE